MTAHPERLYDVVGFDIGTSALGEQPVIAVRFYLQDGSYLLVSLPGELATGLAAQIALELSTLAERPPPASH